MLNLIYMRKYLLSIIFFACAACVCMAQTDSRAQQILSQVSKKYGTYATMKAEFSYQINNPQSKSSQSMNGVLYTQPKANRYRIITGTQDLISDGKLQWTWLKKEREVQLSEVDNSSNAINPARIFTIYEKGYKSLYTGDQKVGSRTAHVIELSPLDTKQSFFKVRLFIDKLNKQLLSALIFDKNGSRYNFIIKSLNPNVKVAGDFFTFDKAKHPGVDVVDLR